MYNQKALSGFDKFYKNPETRLFKALATRQIRAYLKPQIKGMRTQQEADLGIHLTMKEAASRICGGYARVVDKRGVRGLDWKLKHNIGNCVE